jgi:hypothetical protein
LKKDVLGRLFLYLQFRNNKSPESSGLFVFGEASACLKSVLLRLTEHLNLSI